MHQEMRSGVAMAQRMSVRPPPGLEHLASEPPAKHHARLAASEFLSADRQKRVLLSTTPSDREPPQISQGWMARDACTAALMTQHRPGLGPPGTWGQGSRSVYQEACRVYQEAPESRSASKESLCSRSVSKDSVPDSRAVSKDTPSTRCPSKDSVWSLSDPFFDNEDPYEPDSTLDRGHGVYSVSMTPSLAPSPPPSAPPSHQVIVERLVPPPPPPFVAQPRDEKPRPQPEQQVKPGMASVGSAGHHLGICKPCDFAFRGCRAGTSCKFCHLCGPDESQRRKKEKKKIIKSLPESERGLFDARRPGVPVPTGVPVSL